ncbi:hypothetical protein BJ138DRAFT_1118095 [Hygrophoropsis aurantiaca]|uniref:Uncharacterized protein n=1 Tax=Hygrophoropsis aurantiaca TaxID=72124 RepID=A0ACB7ZXQ3_9AGAM|nr:hypothetical protein BJ138DRAFT_1118095 [Hygrophoropsis aurantiaca]
MGSFDARKITGGASGWLRQEYRMLELLDEITLLKYEDSLPGFVDGHRRNTLTNLYRQWKGESYVPSSVPSGIAWTDSDPLKVDNSLENTEWEIVDKRKFKEEKRAADLAKYVPAIGSIPVTTNDGSNKRKAPDESSETIAVKRSRISDLPAHLDGLMGLKWDETNYSCAYDALFTILFHVWLDNPHRWNNHMMNFTCFLNQLVKGFQKVYQTSATFEELEPV